MLLFHWAANLFAWAADLFPWVVILFAWFISLGKEQNLFGFSGRVYFIRFVIKKRNMRRNSLFCLLLFLVVGVNVLNAQKKVELSSPSGKVKVEVRIGDELRWSVWKDGMPVITDNVASLTVNGTVFGNQPKVTKVRNTAVDTSIKPVVPLKQAVVENKYNNLRIDFKGSWSMEFRAYDDGVAYRFLTKKKGKVRVEDEQCAINLPENALLHVQQPFWGFGCNYEDPYSHESIRAWGGEKRKAVLPALIDLQDGRKLLFSESDLQDYPNMFLQGTSEHSFTSILRKILWSSAQETTEALRF